MIKLIHKILLQLRKLLLLIFQFTLRGLFGVYGYISYMMGGGKCRFYPSCSSYSYQAIVKYGIFKGLYLTLHRILRCHPFSKGGYDPLK